MTEWQRFLKACDDIKKDGEIAVQISKDIKEIKKGVN